MDYYFSREKRIMADPATLTLIPLLTTSTMSAGAVTAVNAATIAAVVAVGAGGLMAYSSYEQAQQQQKYAEASALAQERAMEQNALQAQQQGSIEKLKQRNKTQLMISRIRVMSGESGLGTGGGTANALLRQADFDEAANQQIIRQTTQNNIKASLSGAQPISYPGAAGNALLDGISGFQSGLQLGSGIAGTAYNLSGGEQ
jgi:hypothetical protein